ncbi:MAG: protein kinase [Chlamydiales bacterium]|nr:protein kinase [Chlamydiales bacterium]NCF71821.1 protein kinase [Chlamydiales bacterium]
MDKENSSQDDQEPTDELNSGELQQDPIDSFSEEFSPGELAEDRDEEDSLASMIKNDTLDGLDTEEGSLIDEDLIEEMLSDDSELEEEEEESTHSLTSTQEPALEADSPDTSNENTEPEEPTAPLPEQKQNYSFSNQPTLVDDIPASSETIETPSSIGPYKIEGKLDRGGMSILYLGVHPDTQEAITVKVLLPKYLNHSEMKERFLKEAEIISLTDHPNIVKLYGHGDWEKGLYIAMEFVRGVSLKQFILQNAMSVKRSLGIILQVAYALAHLHTHGVIHRDLKPENILLTETGGVKVIDFGIAQLHEQPNSRITQRKRMMGTPIYMSPEQHENPLNVSYTSDIYSLGIIAYELILGKLSHGVVHLNLMPKGLQKILKKMLQPKIEKRYQDIVEVIQELSAYLESPNLEKDVKGKDNSSKHIEQLVAAQEKLLPVQPPSNWPGINIGLANHKTLNLSGLYYDFIELPEGQFAIILGECASKGVEGIMYTAVFRGIIRAISHQIEDPVELVKQVNQVLVQDPLDEVFTLSYLLLDPNANSLRYISCGFGNLWMNSFGSQDPQLIHSENIGLGIEKNMNVLEVSHGWRTGDTLLLNTFSMTTEKDANSKSLKKSFKENILLPPQKQVDTIMRQVKKSSTAKKRLQNRPLTLISIQRQ